MERASQEYKPMRQLAVVSMIMFVACSRSATPGATGTQQASQMRTIENVDPRPAVLDPPPMLQEEAAPPKPTGMPWEPPVAVVLTLDDEKVRASLPFAPAIAMDPIDGSKISIRAATPTFEHKGRIFYFSSEENKRTFVANPDEYTKGPLMRL